MKTATLLLAISALTAFGQKRTVVVEEFKFSTIQSEIQAIFGTQVNLGRGIQAMMVKRIEQGGKLTVVERAALKTLLQEQDLGASNRVKRGTQARIGQISGAQFTLLGDIVTFGRDDRAKSASAAVIVPGAGGGASGYKNTDKAVVTINFRLVNTETSEVVMSGEARGESKRESKGGGAALVTGAFAAGGTFDTTASNFAETIIGEAVLDACDKLAIQIEGQHVKAKVTNTAEIEARVAVVSGTNVYLNAGSSSGVQVGDVFAISHIVREVRDPTTKEILDLETTPVGSLTVVTVRDKIAIGTMSSGTPQVGDRAEKGRK